MSDRHRSLYELAELFGVQTRYWDGFGAFREASPEGVLRIIAAMGAPLCDLADAVDALHERRMQLDGRFVEPVLVCWDGGPLEVEALVPPERDGSWSAVLFEESGEQRRHEGNTDDAPILCTVRRGERELPKKRLCTWDEVSIGYHRLHLEIPGGMQDTLVISAPKTAHIPASVQSESSWGVFAPLYALHSRRSLGTGDLKDLETLSQWLGERGGEMVGVLPLLASFLDEPFSPSPYTPVSRLFWNELFLAIDEIPEIEGSVAAHTTIATEGARRALEEARQSRHLDYRAVMALKRKLLEPLALELFESASPRREQLQAFLQLKPRIVDYAQFRAAVEHHGKSWPHWESKARAGELDATDYERENVQYHLYVQWLMHEQMHKLAARAASAGTGLYLDLPLGVDAQGYDLWRERELFLPDLAVGAPPDALAVSGQNWGFPGLNPERLRLRHYDYLIECIRHHVRFARALRIDHVMGLHRLFVIPNGMDAGGDGAYVSYPHEELYAILCLESARHGCMLVGEDLGTVPEGVRPALAEHGLQRMYVAQFEINDCSDYALNPIPKHSVASFGTHDTPTFAAFSRGLDLDDQLHLGRKSENEVEEGKARRRKLLERASEYLRHAGHLDPASEEPSELLRAFLRYLCTSDASSVLITLEDLWLEEEPQNVPGTAHERPNWRRKLELPLERITNDEQINAVLRELAGLRKGKTQ